MSGARLSVNLDPPHLPNAACRPKDASVEAQRAMLDLFFGKAGERAKEAELRNRDAKAICDTCPELNACRAYALANSRDIGDDQVPYEQRTSATFVGQIIGGLNMRERWAIKHGEPIPPPRLRLLDKPDTLTRTGKPLAPIQHGTKAGHNAHYRRNDLPPCDECKAARDEYRKAKRAAERNAG